MKCKKFKYKDYKNCTFYVGNYINNHKSMAIEIIGEDKELICCCTVNMAEYLYFNGTATIKNYSENAGMTKFLSELGIINTIYSKRQCNPYAGKDETIDFCEINVSKLKEYSSEFNYEYDFE